MKKFFLEPGNIIAFAIALIPSTITWLIQPNFSIPFGVFFILLLITSLSVWVALISKIKYNELEKQDSLRIIEFHKNICICHNNHYVSTESIVSFYKISGNYDELIGHGYVQTITSSNLVQILELENNSGDKISLFHFVEEHQNSVKIKPIITKQSINQLFPQEEYYAR